MADLEKVLGSPYKKSNMDEPKDEPSEEAAEPDHDAYVSKLADLFGLDQSKAEELRDVICGLAKQEMMEEESPEEEKGHGMMGPKKKGLAIVLGGG